MVAIGQTITIVNQSGKIVKTSKHWVNIFNEAKSAYNERKAELRASKGDRSAANGGERRARQHLEALTIDDDDASSMRSSRRNSEDGRQLRRKPLPERQRERPPVERGYSDSFYASDLPSPSHRRQRSHRPSPLRDDSYSSLVYDEPRAGELVRRHTYDTEHSSQHRPETLARSASLDDIDMHLAYGELPPPLPERKYDTEVELRSKMSGLQRLLEECNCLQYSVTAIIDNLQKNPDALAAVALTLAEISNLAAKLAPGALMSLKGSFPAIIALLAAPEFAIAIGVGVGVTIIAFGGYKIIKKIKAKKEAARLLENGQEPGTATPPNEMEELREIGRVEHWRRGIAGVEAESVGTSVDGEFITPKASKALIQEGRLTEGDLKAAESGGKRRQRKTKAKGGQGSHFTQSKSGVKMNAKESAGGILTLFAKNKA